MRPSPLKALAAERGLSLAEVARRTGYSPGTIYSVNRGSVEPWPELRDRLKGLFGVDPFAGDDAPVASLTEEQIRKWAAESCEAQGIALTVGDPTTLRRIAAIVAGSREANRD